MVHVISIILAFYTALFTTYILSRIIRRARHHFPKSTCLVARTAAILLAALLLAASARTAEGQTRLEAFVHYDASYSLSLDRRSSGVGVGLELSHRSDTGLFAQSVSVVRTRGRARLSAKASWTRNGRSWQRVSVFSRPGFRRGSRKRFLGAEHLLSVPIGARVYADHMARVSYVLDGNAGIAYSPFLYRRWQAGMVSFDAGPRGYTSAYLRDRPGYWTPRLAAKVGPGARVSLRSRPVTLVLDGFVGPAVELVGNGRWARTQNVYLALRGEYSITDRLEVSGHAHWSSSGEIGSAATFSELSVRVGMSRDL